MKCRLSVHHDPDGMQVVDYNFLSTLLSFIGQYMPDFKVQRAANKARE